MSRADDFEIQPYMYAGSTLGNALYSQLNLEEVFSCVRQAQSFEGFDAAVSATIALKELTMSIEPTCEFCGVSVKPRCRSQQASDGCSMKRKETTIVDNRRDERRKVTSMALTMEIENGDQLPLTIASHYKGDIGMVSIQQGAIPMVISVKDIDGIIDNLNQILTHLQ